MAYEDRQKVFETIKALVKTEQEEIFRIIRKLKVTYSENSNGIFFDLALLTDDSFSQIKEYIEFCLTNRKEHEERLKEMEQFRQPSA